ncbi:hypothetical protein H0H87_005446 [Tephrocybe sp. NHM501043]|nr:hypothetical protein H0H87_005446 [Tephrocybe sp. NHM501043]
MLVFAYFASFAAFSIFGNFDLTSPLATQKAIAASLSFGAAARVALSRPVVHAVMRASGLTHRSFPPSPFGVTIQAPPTTPAYLYPYLAANVCSLDEAPVRSPTTPSYLYSYLAANVCSLDEAPVPASTTLAYLYSYFAITSCSLDETPVPAPTTPVYLYSYLAITTCPLDEAPLPAPTSPAYLYSYLAHTTCPLNAAPIPGPVAPFPVANSLWSRDQYQYTVLHYLLGITVNGLSLEIAALINIVSSHRLHHKTCIADGIHLKILLVALGGLSYAAKSSANLLSVEYDRFTKAASTHRKCLVESVRSFTNVKVPATLHSRLVTLASLHYKDFAENAKKFFTVTAPALGDRLVTLINDLLYDLAMIRGINPETLGFMPRSSNSPEIDGDIALFLTIGFTMLGAYSQQNENPPLPKQAATTATIPIYISKKKKKKSANPPNMLLQL